MNSRASIPAGIQESIAAASGVRPLALLLRHADRAEIPAGEAGDDVGLLPVGRDRSLALARALAHLGGVAWAEASPLSRCMTTARLLTTAVEASDLLGAPGPFVVDREDGGHVFASLGTEHVVRAQMAGHPWDFMRPLDGGAKLLLRHIRDRLGERTGIGVFISHDAIVMPAIAWATGDRFGTGWLAPLDGVVVSLAGERGLTVWWKGEPTEVSP